MLFSQSAFAKLIGTTRQTINDLVRNGIIEVVNKKIDSDKAINKLRAEGKIDDKGKFVPKNSSKKEEPEIEEKNIFDYPSISTLTDDEREAQRAKQDFDHEMRKEEAKRIDMPLDAIMNANIKSMSKNDAERVKLYWQGLYERVKYEMLIGTLIEFKEAEEDYGVVVRAIRDSLIGMPRRIGHKLIAKKDIHEISLIIDEEVSKIMENLSK